MIRLRSNLYRTALTTLTLALTASACEDESKAPAALPCDVQRVLSENCQGCHQSPTRFGAPMPLLSYADLHASGQGEATVLKRVAARIEDVERPMPPRPNKPLSDADKGVLQAWLEAGAPAATAGDAERCDLGETPRAVYSSPDTEPDDCKNSYEFRAHGDDLDAPWPLPASGGDEGNRYMCFYFDTPWQADEKALWLHSQVDNSQVLHHWILYGTDRLPQPAGTFQPCSAVQLGAYFIAGWAPGGGDYALPSNVEMDLPSGKGSGLILEVHYFNTSGQSAVDHSGVRVCTAPKGTREHTAGVTFTGSEGICVGPGGKQTVSGLCNPSDDAGDIHVIGAWPHMHKLGRHMKITVLRADGREEVMHDAPFDFQTQEYYPFAQDQWVLHSGDRLRTECTFQNESTRSVPFGERTQDEMCYGFITSWPAGALQNDPRDLTQLIAGPFQQERRCLNPISIFQSCNGINDFPSVTK